MTSQFKRLWKNEYFQTAIMIVLILAIVLGFWYGSRIVLNTDYPALAVASGSMCKVQHMFCDGWSHPFGRTLHVGDLIIVQGVPPEDIKAAPEPDGDIIVFRVPGSIRPDGDLIVHRAVEKIDKGGSISFRTKGDGNDDRDSWEIPADHVVGKVVLRIPWVGHLALYMRNSSGILIVVALIIIIIVVEVAFSFLRGKKTQTGEKMVVERHPET